MLPKASQTAAFGSIDIMLRLLILLSDALMRAEYFRGADAEHYI